MVVLSRATSHDPPFKHPAPPDAILFGYSEQKQYHRTGLRDKWKNGLRTGALSHLNVQIRTVICANLFTYRLTEATSKFRVLTVKGFFPPAAEEN
jgi:hypothetical protein